MAIDVKIPELGESISEGTILAWLVEEGEAVAEDQPLLELETDKVTAELPSPVAGTVVKRLAEEGDDVAVGAVVAHIEPGEGAATGGGSSEANEASAPAEASAEARPEAEQPEPAPVAKAGAGPQMPPLPAAQRAMAEHGVDASRVEGSGRRGQIRKEDVMAHLESAPPPAAATAVPASSTRPQRRVKMTRMRRSIARHLKETQNTAAMLTTFNEVDMAPVMELRNQYKQAFVDKHGVKLGFMSFFVKAAVEALKAYPRVNAYIDGDHIVYNDYYDVGIAVSSDRGLVVPVVRDADRLSFAEVEKEIGALAKSARDGKLTLDDLQGGTFSITNGGIFGSMLSTPILNGNEQSAILGMHNIVKRPWVVGDEVQVRPVMYLALSYDHRIVDGAEAVRFLVAIKSIVEDPARLLLEL